MPRLRCLINPDWTGEEAAALPRSCGRIRRMHLLLDDLQLADTSEEARKVPARPSRYLLVQVYADAGRGCGEAIALGDEPAEVLAATAHEMSDGWVPSEVVDLDTGDRWPVTLVPAFSGPTKPPATVAAATAALDALAEECEYDPDGECSGDALVDYKDAVEDRLRSAIAAGWSA